MSAEQKEMVAVSSSEFVEEMDKSFDVSDLNAVLVSVANISGAIVVEAWAQPGVSIHVVKRARSRRAFERTRVEFAQEGDQISARTVVDEDVFVKGVLDWMKGEKSIADVRYSVHVPAACAVRVKTVNGPVDLTGLNQKSEAHSVNGSVNLRQLSGHVEASAVNGSLRAEAIAGDADLNTVNGSMELIALRVKTLDARTVSGNLRAQLSVDPAGRYNFSSTNGSCEVIIPSDSRCTLSMQAVNGGVNIELPHRTVASEMRPAFSRWEGEVNGGGAPIHFSTINGRMRVSSDGQRTTGFETARATGDVDAPGVSQSSNEPSAARSTMDILRAVERGELSVDDAMQQIKR